MKLGALQPVILELSFFNFFGTVLASNSTTSSRLSYNEGVIRHSEDREDANYLVDSRDVSGPFVPKKAHSGGQHYRRRRKTL